MRVLNCFDKYLNSTMNWAYNAIAHTPDTQPMIAAPLIVKNQFYDKRFTYFLSEWQWEFPDDEWSVSWQQRGAARFFRNRYWKKVFEKLEKEPPAIIHAHFAPVGCEVMDLVGKKGLPLIVSFYGADYERLPYKWSSFRLKYQRLFEQSKLLLCEGEHGASILAGMGCPESKIRVAPLGIEIENIPFHVREKLPNRLLLLQAATIVEKKGHMITLEALRLALHTCPGIHLTIVGEPVNINLVKTMRRYIAENRLENKVAWLDFVDTRQFHQFLQKFDVFIHPSCYAADRDCEGGAPVVLLDAQATGLPVIATTHCDIPSEVLHERTGLLAPERDAATLAAHIERFYRMDNAEYQKFARNARSHVEQNFDVKKTAQKLRNLYAQIAHRSSFIVHRSP
jgi:colanic acid/amylovoran biosynthesis glycosyltransferase